MITSRRRGLAERVADGQRRFAPRRRGGESSQSIRSSICAPTTADASAPSPSPSLRDHEFVRLRHRPYGRAGAHEHIISTDYEDTEGKRHSVSKMHASPRTCTRTSSSSSAADDAARGEDADDDVGRRTSASSNSGAIAQRGRQRGSEPHPAPAAFAVDPAVDGSKTIGLSATGGAPSSGGGGGGSSPRGGGRRAAHLCESPSSSAARARRRGGGGRALPEDLNDGCARGSRTATRSSASN